MSERIDHTNYEAWLLDRMEGNLNAHQEQELATFLVLHPELIPQNDEWATVPVRMHQLPAGEKERLKRDLPPSGMPGSTDLDELLIARLENDLTTEQQQALLHFLVEHPEHHVAERVCALTKLVPEAMAFPAKQELLRQLPPLGTPTRYTLDDFLVARLEGDLTSAQSRSLDAYLSEHPSAARAWIAMQRTRTTSGPMIYVGKAALKKTQGRVVAFHGVRPLFAKLAVAASVVVMLGVGMWFLDTGASDQGQLAHTDKPVVSVGRDGVTTSTPETAPGSIPVPSTSGAAYVQAEAVASPSSSGRSRTNSTVSSPVRHEKPTLLEREEVLPLAQQRDVFPTPHAPNITLRDVIVPDVPISDGPLADAISVPAENVPSLGGMLASAIRGQVLEQRTADTRPLDGNDALAVVDKGLKTVAGERAGFAVERRGGRLHSFDLRLGRNLAIAANR